MLTLRIALRYLFSRKTHSAVNVISMISVIGVAVATIAIVCVLSVFNGFSELALDKISHIAPDLRIESSRGKIIADADSLLKVISAIDDVEKAAPTIEEKGLLIYDSNQLPVELKGITQDYSEIKGIDSLVKSDGIFLLNDSLYGDFAILSIGVAINLNARPSTDFPLEVYVPNRLGRYNPANPAASFRSDTLLVGGVYQSEQAEYDTNTALVPLDMMRSLLDYPCEATAIEVKVADSQSTEKVKKAIAQQLSGEYTVKNRLQQQEQSFKMIEVEKWITFVLLAFILIIASFNIISTLSMLIIEKDSNIRTLYSLGATKTAIRRIFIMEGWLISAAGGIFGIIVGVAMCLAQEWWGFIKLGGNHDAMSTDIYPVKVEFVDIVSVLLLVALIGLFTSLLTSVFMRKRLSQGDN